MSMRAARSWVVVVAVVAAGCGSKPPSASSPWPADAGRDLVSTEMLLVGGAAAGGVVADRAGMLWVDGPDLVARVNPADGAATVWDAADDLAFAAVRHLSPAQPAGVWIDTGDRVLLFDGQRFSVDVALPRQYADDIPEMPRGEVLQVGDELWASGMAGVGRWVDGQWSAVGLASLASAGPLALDGQGAVWAGAILDSDGQKGAAVRFDGTAWVTPGDATTAPHGVIGDIAADPSGGVWVASTGTVEGSEDAGIFRFDGATWRRVGPGGLVRDLSVTTDGQVWAMASAGAGVDPAGESMVARLVGDGTWQSYAAADGAPQSGEFTAASLGAAGDTVVVSHDAGLVQWDGDGFEDLWDDPAAVIRARYDVSPDGVLAVSADEVWVPASDFTRTPASGVVSSLDRWRGGAWEAVLVGVSGQTVSPPVLASDGAVWVVTPEGLTRIAFGRAAVVDDRIAGYRPSSLAAGADGGVWAIDGGSVVRVGADGRRTDIGRPSGTTRLWEVSPLAAPVDGTDVWVALPTDRHGTARLAHWDGAWTLVDVPVDEGYVTQVLAPADGSVWLVLDSPDRGLARFAQGSWSFDSGAATGLAAAPDGSVCSLRANGVQCYDAALSLVRTIPVAAGDGPSALGIASDGAVWVLGEQIALVAGGA